MNWRDPKSIETAECVVAPSLLVVAHGTVYFKATQDLARPVAPHPAAQATSRLAPHAPPQAAASPPGNAVRNPATLAALTCVASLNSAIFPRIRSETLGWVSRPRTAPGKEGSETSPHRAG
jgi:hypothetical protein